MLAKHYFLAMVMTKKSMEILPIRGPDLKDMLKDNQGKLAKQLISVPLGDNLSRTIQIEALLFPNLQSQLVAFL